MVKPIRNRAGFGPSQPFLGVQFLTIQGIGIGSTAIHKSWAHRFRGQDISSYIDDAGSRNGRSLALRRITLPIVFGLATEVDASYHLLDSSKPEIEVIHMEPKRKHGPASILQTKVEDVVANALNEQGYLFQYRVIQSLQTEDDPKLLGHEWRVEASEVPVSLPDGNETKIDIVLRHGSAQDNPWHLVVECKRASPEYKRWIFFGQAGQSGSTSPNSYHTEHAHLSGTWDHQGEPPMSHHAERVPAKDDCPIFDYYVEAKMNRLIGNGNKSSATNTIEKAFQQVTLGQAGLALKFLGAHSLNFWLIPIVVTSADVMSAHFDIEKVSLERGEINRNDLKLEPRKWIAVNYRVNDTICQFSGFTLSPTTSVANQVLGWQLRTVYVVQSSHIHPFLAWLDRTFPRAARR